MFTHGLTLEQQDFAEENHNLIYSFLSAKKLPENDYYDVVVFGYLRAVCQYCSRADLRQKYTFSTIAWRKMQDDLIKHYKKAGTLRKTVTISLEGILYGCESLTVSETLSLPERDMEGIESKLIWEQIAALLNEDQTITLRLRADGYTNREIAAKRNRRLREIENTFRDIRAVVIGLCLI